MCHVSLVAIINFVQIIMIMIIFLQENNSFVTQDTHRNSKFVRQRREKVFSVQFEQCSEMRYNNTINNHSAYLVPHYSDFVNTDNRTINSDELLPGSLCSFSPCPYCLLKLCDGGGLQMCVWICGTWCDSYAARLS